MAETEMFLYQIARQYYQTFPGDNIGILISDKNADLFNNEATDFAPIILRHHDSPVLNNLLTRKRMVSKILEFQPDVIITTYPAKGLEQIPQILLISPQSEALLRNQKTIQTKQKEALAKYIDLCKITIVFSELEKQFIAINFPGRNEKIRVVHRIVSYGNKPLSYNDKQKIKEQFTNGNEYFLVAPEDDERILVNVLKGFSGFKKWQRSSMKLILTARDEDEKNKLIQLVSTYRFRDEIIIIIASDHSDFFKLIASAYLVLLPNKYNSNFSMAIKTLEASIPLMIAENSIYTEVLEDAAFVFRFQNKDDITRVFLESFRDETQRMKIINQSEEIKKSLSSKNFFSQLRDIIV